MVGGSDFLTRLMEQAAKAWLVLFMGLS